MKMIVPLNPPRKPIIFSMKDDGLSRFVSTIDLNNHVELLSQYVDDFLMVFPFAAMTLDWPPAKIFLKGVSQDSPLKTLYKVLSAHLSESGYPITVLPTMTVIHHEPFDTTLIEASQHTRVASLH